ncbi:MAG: glycosyltransferase family 61 protein [Alphaproteobacteria bacterium]|nr:glycosyltransferase family 61 protein [Alphaproteobacteria bacterium]
MKTTTPEAEADSRIASWRTEIAAARRPAELLCLRLDDLAAAANAAADADAIRLFESSFWRLPPFADDWLPLLAAAAYDRLDRPDCAALLASLAVQMQPGAPAALPAYRILHARFTATGRPAEAAGVAARLHVLFLEAEPPPADAPTPDALAEEVARIATSPDAALLLLSALERLEHGGDRQGAARLFEASLHRVPPLAEYWIYCRMTEVYAALDKHDTAALLASLCIQLDPEGVISFAPFAHLFGWYERAGRRADAVALARRLKARHGTRPMPNDVWLAPLLAAAGPVAAPADAHARRDHVVFAAETRAAAPVRTYGGATPVGLRELSTDMRREPVTVSELHDAEILVGANVVAVFGRDGLAHGDLSVGGIPALLRRRLEDAKRSGLKVEQATLDAAVLASDVFPGANPCHFLLDHASRVLLYARAGVDLAGATVIGPALRTEYQRVTAERLRVAGWRGTSGLAWFSARRLWVSSTCRALQHPAHWGAEWALASVRALFDLAPRTRTRRLLISREDAGYRLIANAAEITPLLQACGFEVIVPGRLPFAEQVAAFRDATHVIGPHGAAFANTLFCAPGTHVLEAFHPQYGTWAYAILGQALGLDYAALACGDGESDAAEFNDPAWPLAHRNVRAGRNLRVDPAALRQWLADSGAC